MRIFVSYARHDRIVVDALLQDIRRARHDVWVDEELTGGQSWWDTILGTIRGADLFVVALSPDWLRSKACAAELHYAVACNRPVLSIMVGRVSPQMAPPVIADAQILDYVERTPDAAISLVTALSATRPSGPLPQPLPAGPPVPMSYMNTYRERVDQLTLTFQEQSQLLSELRAHLSDDDDRECATELIQRLRHRGDITESIGLEIDSLLASAPTPLTMPPQEPSTATQVTPAVVVPPPPVAAAVDGGPSDDTTGGLGGRPGEQVGYGHLRHAARRERHPVHRPHRDHHGRDQHQEARSARPGDGALGRRDRRHCTDPCQHPLQLWQRHRAVSQFRRRIGESVACVHQQQNGKVLPRSGRDVLR